MDLGPTDVPRHLTHDYHICRSMTYLLANFEYIYLFDVWVRKFNKLKWALTYTVLLLRMYYFCLELSYVYHVYFIESCSCLFYKLLRTLISFDLSSNFQLDIEWLMLYEPLSKPILEDYNFGVP